MKQRILYVLLLLLCLVQASCVKEDILSEQPSEQPFAPKELLVTRGYEKGVKERYGDHYYISTLEEWAFVYESSVEKLKRQLQVDSLKGFAIDNFPLGITSAGALLIYLEQQKL